MGTLTAYATKVSTSFVSHILPYVRSYPLLSKSPGYNEINVMYPRSLLVGVTGKAGDEPIGLINPSTGESAELLLNADMAEIFEEMRGLNDQTLMDTHGVDRGEMETKIALYWQQKQEITTSTKNFWKLIDENSDKIIKLDDAEMDAKFVGTKGSPTWWVGRNNNLYADDTSNMSSLSDTLLTRWSGWCVPSAMAWVYMAEGFDQKYFNGRRLPSYNNVPLYNKGHSKFEYTPFKDASMTNFRRGLENATGFYNYTGLDRSKIRKASDTMDGGLYADLMEWGYGYAGGGGVGSLFHNKMVRNMTGNKRGAQWTPLWDDVHSHIYRNDDPVFIEATFTRSSTGESKRHYITLAGTIEVTRYWNWWFIFKFTSREREVRMYLVHDNGSVTGKQNRLPAGKHEGGGGHNYENKHEDKDYYPYWFHESQIYGLTTAPYLFK